MNPLRIFHETAGSYIGIEISGREDVERKIQRNAEIMHALDTLAPAAHGTLLTSLQIRRQERISEAGLDAEKFIEIVSY